MTTITFDTLAYSENMQKAGFTREQADAMAKANAAAFQNMVDTKQLVTKQDIEELRQATKDDIAEVKQEIAAVKLETVNTKMDLLKWLIIGLIFVQAILVILTLVIGRALLK